MARQEVPERSGDYIQLDKGRRFNIDDLHYDEVEQAELERGYHAIESISKTFEQHWVQVGRSIDVLRRKCMHVLQLNDVSQTSGNTKGYSILFSHELKAKKYDQANTGLDGAGRKHLLACLDQLPAVMAWRQTLSVKERQGWNHPTTVFKRWQASFQETVKQPRVSAKDARIAELEAELDKLKDERNTWRQKAEAAEWELASVKTKLAEFQTPKPTRNTTPGRMRAGKMTSDRKAQERGEAAAKAGQPVWLVTKPGYPEFRYSTTADAEIAVALRGEEWQVRAPTAPAPARSQEVSDAEV